jgi:hypothetical protein
MTLWCGTTLDDVFSDGGVTVQGPHKGVHKKNRCAVEQSPVVEHKDKDHAAGLEIAKSFILCGHHAY